MNIAIIEQTPENECPGHSCDENAGEFPYAAIGDIFYCDGSCQGAA